ncbi:MAG: DNA-protecting protein DprA [Alphaproteobacteria bacterium]|nr:DNA-protecting protein DprA [Alphaproteobacteria bacterium]
MKMFNKKHFESSDSNDSQIIDFLQLARSQNVGPITFYKILEKYGTVSSAIDNFNDIAISSNRNIRLLDRKIAIEEFEKTQNFGAKFLTFTDPLYPQALREISDCPPIITVKGDLDLLKQEKISVVGPRNASFNALLYAKKFTLLLGQNSIVSVSGMARGVDTAVHEASLLSGTIAVLAGGIDNIYPIENTKLYHQIAECGIILSEMPIGFSPKGPNFIQRNRLISGLSVATVIIEAGLQSGSLATARFAIEQNREVFAVPGSPFDPRCQGTNRLIKEGANIITEVEDILTASTQKNNQLKKISQISKIKKDYNFSNDEIGLVSKKILENLNSEPTNVDQLIAQLQIPINLFNTAIIQLEIDNLISLNYGKIAKLITE